jgi:hypothetical protein
VGFPETIFNSKGILVGFLLGVSLRLTSPFWLFCLMRVFRHQDWLGEGRLQIRGLHPIGARAHVGKSVAKCGVKSGKR